MVSYSLYLTRNSLKLTALNADYSARFEATNSQTNK